MVEKPHVFYPKVQRVFCSLQIDKVRFLRRRGNGSRWLVDHDFQRKSNEIRLQVIVYAGWWEKRSSIFPSEAQKPYLKFPRLDKFRYLL